MLTQSLRGRLALASVFLFLLSACSPDGRSPAAGGGTPSPSSLNAVNDSFSVALNATVNLNVLSNDDLGVQPTTIVSAGTTSGATGASVAPASDGLSLDYTAPTEGSTDQLNYSIRDNSGATSAGFVTITLINGIAANADEATTDEGNAINIAVLDNDSTSAAPLTIDSIVTNPANGTAVINGNEITYTPNADFPNTGANATDSFEYRATDNGGNDATATVTVTVLDVPVATADFKDLYKGGRGGEIVLADLHTAVLSNDSEGLTVTAVEFDTATARTGTIFVDSLGTEDTADDIIRYFAPTDSSVASEEVTYTVQNQEGREATGTLTVNLAAPESCDTNVAQRRESGLGWCYETYFDSFDESDGDSPFAHPDQVGDGTGTNIAIQVFIPHPWHQRQNAINSGITLADGEAGYSPLLIHSHGFGGSKREDFQDPTTLATPEPADTFLDSQLAREAWEDGYNVISYTQRGFGGSNQSGSKDNEVSGDSIGILSPNLEGFDFIRLVDWAICHLRADAPLEAATAAQNNEVDANNCATAFNGENNWGASLIATDDGTRLDDYDDDVSLATVGYSYGGGFQFLAQSIDTRVDAIMPMGTWHDLRFSLHPNDTPKFLWIEVMNQFSGTTPGLGGGNGEPVPELLTQARTESNGANAQPDDNPHNKDHQVSVGNARQLGSKGPAAWCNDNQGYYSGKYNAGSSADVHQDPESLQAATTSETPVHMTVTRRAPRANLFMIQGYGDTLFNYNEGYDNARCFEDAGIADVRLLQQTSGHPFPNDANNPVPPDAIPKQYAGQNQAMYLDEIVHCGVDGDGNPVRYNMVEVLQQWMNFHTRQRLLPDGSQAEATVTAFPETHFPTVCITQTNADPDLTLDESDPFYNGTNDADVGYQWSREGVVFDSVASAPLGHSQYLDAQSAELAPFNMPAGVTVITGVTAATTPQITPAELYTATDPNGEVLAGIPLVHLTVDRPNTAVDDIVYAGVYVKRCNLDPDDTQFDGNNSPTNCDASNPEELLHFQAAPIRVFPSSAAAAAAQELPPSTSDFPKLNPRMFPGDANLGGYYPLGAGYHPQTMRGTGTDVVNNSSTTDPQGRLFGVSARLHPGDTVGLALYAGHYAFLGMAAATPSQVTITGTVELPLVNTTAENAPTNVPSYVVEAQ